MTIYRVNINQVWLSQQVMNVIYYDTTGILSTAQQIEAANDIRAAWVTFDSTGRLSADWSYTGLTFRQMDVPNLPETTVTPTAGPYVGIAAGENLPTQIAMLVTGQANTAFPRRVRTYIAGLTEGSAVDGIWTTPAATAGLVLVGSALDQVVVAGDSLDRVSVRLTDPGTGVIVSAFNRVASYNVTNVPATQRRRRIGVGA